jgi:hypothetical protein
VLAINQVVLSLKRTLFANQEYKKLSEELDYLDTLKDYTIILPETWNNVYSGYSRIPIPENFKKLNYDHYVSSLRILFEKVINKPFPRSVDNKELLFILLNSWPKEFKETNNPALNKILFFLVNSPHYRDYSYYYSETVKNKVQSLINVDDNPGVLKGVMYKGRIYKVYYFSNNSNTNTPLEQEETIEDNNPRSGQKVYKNIKIPVSGNTPFIQIREYSKEYPETMVNTWVKVNPNSVKNYYFNNNIPNRNNKFGFKLVCPSQALMDLIIYGTADPSTGGNGLAYLLNKRISGNIYRPATVRQA